MEWKPHLQKERQNENAEDQMKEQGKTPEKQLKEVEIENFPEK